MAVRRRRLRKAVTAVIFVLYCLSSFVFLSSSQWIAKAASIETFQLQIKAGWNFVSVPLTPSESDPSTVFPGILNGNVMGFNSLNEYETATSIQAGNAYWVKYDNDTTIAITGSKIVLPFTVDVNIKSTDGDYVAAFGIPSTTPISWSSVIVNNLDTIRVTPYDAVTQSYLVYNESNISLLVLQPGQGYFIESSKPGSITFSDTQTTQTVSPTPLSPTQTLVTPIPSTHLTSTPMVTNTPSNIMPSASLWTDNSIAVVSVVSVGLVGIVSVVAFRHLRTSRRTLWNRLVAKGEILVKKNDLASAAECFAKASIVGFKDKTNIAAVKASERYTNTAKSLIINSVLRDSKTEAIERVCKLQRELTKFVSDRSLQALIVDSNFEGFSSLNLLIDKARENDLDFIVNAAFKVPEIEKAFLGIISGLDEILLAELAVKLGYSGEVTSRLLMKGISLGEVKGYITSDDKKYVSEEYVQKQLYTHLE
jgi:hypothetical protein